jgi:HPt (histidine-containing phosphotransfer) domain-containing protein
MDDYLAKPLQESELQDIAQRFLVSGARPVEAAQDHQDTPGAATTLGFDLAKIRSLCRNDAAQVGEMLQLFIDSSEEIMGHLVQALAQGDARQTARQAHQIKGAAAYLGAVHMADLAAALESAAKQDRLEEAESVLAALQSAFAECRQAMKTLM